MKGSMIGIMIVIGAVLWISYVAGGIAAAVIIAFLAGAIVTVGIQSMTSGQATNNAKSAAAREKAIDLREKALVIREANVTREIDARVKQLAGERYLTWKARFEAEHAAKMLQQQQPKPAAAPVRQPINWTEADL